MSKDPFKPQFSLSDVERSGVSLEYQRFGKLSLYSLKHRLFDGGWSNILDREIYDTGDAVAVLPYNPHTEEVVLVKQFRLPAYHRSMQPWLIECIAGRISQNEPPEQTAIREADEEAGLMISDIVKVSDAFASPGAFAEFVHLFCAKFDNVPRTRIHGLEEEGENIQAIIVSFDDALNALDRGLIKAAPAQICLNWLARNREKIKNAWGEGLEPSAVRD